MLMTYKCFEFLGFFLSPFGGESPGVLMLLHHTPIVYITHNGYNLIMQD